MSEVRDPDRDQPLPTPGQVNVHEALMAAITERMEHGTNKYGRPLETFNGRDALQDMWEELIDMLSYLTQLRLERGDVLPGMKLCGHCGHPKHDEWEVCGHRLKGDRETPVCMCLHDTPKPVGT